MKWGELLWWIFFMSVILACWTDGTAQVSEDLRWRAVLLYEDDGYSYAKIALLLRLSESSCRRYVRMWYKFHTVRPVRYRRERNPIPPEHMEHLIGLLREDAALYLYEMRMPIRLDREAPGSTEKHSYCCLATAVPVFRPARRDNYLSMLWSSTLDQHGTSTRARACVAAATLLN